MISFYTFLDNLKLKLLLAGTNYSKNGEEYVRIEKSQVAVKIVKMKLKFDNLFNGDRVLSDLGNSLVNENINLFVKDVEPSLQVSLGELYNKTFSVVGMFMNEVTTNF